jgi:hypothetical protein
MGPVFHPIVVTKYSNNTAKITVENVFLKAVLLYKHWTYRLFWHTTGNGYYTAKNTSDTKNIVTDLFSVTTVMPYY